MRTRITHTVPEETWRRFVEEHPQSNIFHTPEMFQVFARAKGHRPALWAAIDHGDRLLALLLPVQVTLTAGRLRQWTSRAVAYGSVLCGPGQEAEEALKALLTAYRQETKGKVLYTELRNLSDLSALQPTLETCGFLYEHHLNYLIDLNRSPEVVLQSIGRRTRKRIRRALRQNSVIIQEVDRPSEVMLCYALLRKSYAAACVPLADRSLFEAAFDLLYPLGMVKFLLAWIGGQCAAGSVELIYKDRIYGWYSGVDRAYSSFAPDELLMWEILRWGAEQGYRLYDFGGAGAPDEEYGVREHKAKFGGELVCFGRNTLVHSPARLAATKVGYGLYRRLRQTCSLRRSVEGLRNDSRYVRSPHSRGLAGC